MRFVFLIATQCILHAQTASRYDHVTQNELDDTNRSPLGRHLVASPLRKICIGTHAYVVPLILMLYVVQWMMPKGTSLHVGMGKIAAWCLAPMVILSGFLLYVLHAIENSGANETHLVPVQSLFLTYGFCFSCTCVQTFFSKRFIHPYFTSLMLRCHQISILLWIYVTTGLIHGIEYAKTLSLDSEIRIELCILALALPIFDAINITAMKRCLHQQNWTRFHVANAHMMTYLAVLGTVFTISHDAYWVWTYPGIQSLSMRILIQTTPLLLCAKFCFVAIKKMLL